MNLQRLKFAWARGARIERAILGNYPFGQQDWIECVPWKCPDPLRIHPDDEHLQYGSLSQALRNRLLFSKVEFQDTYQAAIELLDHHVPSTFIAITEKHKKHVELYMLFMAELLADEGL